MRHHRTLTLCAALAATAIFKGYAGEINQTPVQPGATNSYVPARFAYDGKSMLSFAYNPTYDDSDRGYIRLFDGNLKQIRHIELSDYPLMFRILRSTDIGILRWSETERTYVPEQDGISLDEYYEYRNNILPNHYGFKVENDREEYDNGILRINWTGPYSYQTFPSITDAEGGTIQEAQLATRYFIYTPSQNGNPASLIEVRCGGTPSFEITQPHEGDPQRIAYEATPQLICFDIFDYDSGATSIGNASATQTLFNTDAGVEYLTPTYEEKISYWPYSPRCIGGLYYEIDRQWSNSPSITGFKVVGENGTELQSIEFPDPYYADWQSNFMSLIMIGGKKYLSCNLKKPQSAASYTLMYEITDNGGGLRQAAAPIKTRVYPTAAHRGETITVETEDSEATFGVTDISGRGVYRGSIAAGEGTATIPSSAMPRGLNIVTVNIPGNPPESTKVIVE